MADAQRSEVIKDESSQSEKFERLASQLLKVPKEEANEIAVGKRCEEDERRVA